MQQRFYGLNCNYYHTADKENFLCIIFTIKKYGDSGVS